MKFSHHFSGLKTIVLYDSDLTMTLLSLQQTQKFCLYLLSAWFSISVCHVLKGYCSSLAGLEKNIWSFIADHRFFFLMCLNMLCYVIKFACFQIFNLKKLYLLLH